MIESDPLLTLPALQRRLDHLDLGEQLTIPNSTYRRLFGHNDVGAARLFNFATGHGCTADHREESITFRKRTL